jgi:hypothetical protein
MKWTVQIILEIEYVQLKIFTAVDVIVMTLIRGVFKKSPTLMANFIRLEHCDVLGLNFYGKY